jgi:cyclophilin family peptidyl-prolyl cis-trans isomerase/protein-disulfide isomerase
MRSRMNSNPHWGSSLLSVLLVLLLAACNPVQPTSTSTQDVQPILTPTPEFMACMLLPYTPGIEATMTATLDASAHVLGPADAAVTLVLFTDFQCPGCALLALSLEQVRLAHPQEIRLVVRYLPDANFDKSRMAMQAAEAADLQGKFWEMYTLLFEKQPDWYGLDPAVFPAWVLEQAGALGMDGTQFEADLNSEQVSERVELAFQAAETSQYLPPLLYINSTTPYSGVADTTSLDTIVRLALLEGQKFHTCPPWSIDPYRQYLATLHTARGDIILQLNAGKAPLAVNNFVFLAQAGWFDNTPFQVQPGFVIQGGDPSGTGFGNPGYYFATEAVGGTSFEHAGMVGMSNVGIDTNGSQFFITYAPAPQLDGQFTIFGEVLAGMDILENLASGDTLLSVTVEER